jgi:hypothetical protein
MALIVAALTLATLAVVPPLVDYAYVALAGQYRFTVRAPVGRCYGWYTPTGSAVHCYPAPTATKGTP